MPEDTLREHLAAIEGDAPSPAFLASLAVHMEDEAAGAAESDLPVYLAERAGEPSASAGPGPVPSPGGSRRGTVVAVAAAAVLVIVGLVVADRGDEGSQLATDAVPSAYTASVLPSALIQEGDGDVVVDERPRPRPRAVVPRRTLGPGGRGVRRRARRPLRPRPPRS